LALPVNLFHRSTVLQNKVAPILELQWLYTMAIGNGLSTI